MSANKESVIAENEAACALAIAKLPVPLPPEEARAFKLGFLAGTLHQIDRHLSFLAERAQ